MSNKTITDRIREVKEEKVSSRAYPGLERSPGGPDNWVEAAGGLPSYIERIAKHLHYEKGMTISRAIATAVNVVKKMCAGGDLNFPGKQNIKPTTRAKACAAVAEWTKKKASGKKICTDKQYIEEKWGPYVTDFEMASDVITVIDLEESDDFD
jgi:hypothetical protein